MADLIANMVGKFVPSALPPADAFSNQTIVITGGTSGLGVAAAVHYLSLGAKEVIITARRASSLRAEEAKTNILKLVQKSKKKGNEASKGTVTAMDLDMNSYESCVAFVEQLKQREGGVDVVVLNAGAMNTVFVKSPQGLEETIQVNSVSTILLALLLLPWLKQQPRKPTHLVFVGSGSHLLADIKPWPAYVTQDGGVIAHYAKEENFPPGALSQLMYATSKLILHYAVEEVCKLALGNDGKPQVIVTLVCPGPVATDIARNLTANSLAAKVLLPLFWAAQGKSPDYGARIYVNASVATPEQHGKFLRDYYSDKQYEAKSKFIMSSPEGRKMQAEIWREIKEILIAKAPAVQETLKQQ